MSHRLVNVVVNRLCRSAEYVKLILIGKAMALGDNVAGS